MGTVYIYMISFIFRANNIHYRAWNPRIFQGVFHKGGLVWSKWFGHFHQMRHHLDPGVVMYRNMKRVLAFCFSFNSWESIISCGILTIFVWQTIQLVCFHEGFFGFDDGMNRFHSKNWPNHHCQGWIGRWTASLLPFWWNLVGKFVGQFLQYDLKRQVLWTWRF